MLRKQEDVKSIVLLDWGTAVPILQGVTRKIGVMYRNSRVRKDIRYQSPESFEA